MHATTPDARDPKVSAKRTRSRGQVLVIFAGALFLLMLIAAVVVDVSWYWVNSLRVQRAADAAALAGAVMLPKHANDGGGSAYDLAFKEATKDGYPDGTVVAGVPGTQKIKVVPQQDTDNPRRLNVTITAPVGTFFMRVMGIPALNVTRTSKAEFTLPVPMGSPEAFYGVGFYEGQETTLSPSAAKTTGFDVATQDVFGGLWNRPDRANGNTDGRYATEDTNGQAQVWTNFDLINDIDNDPTVVIDGIQVQLANVSLTGSGNGSNCRMKVETTWNGNNAVPNWSTAILSNPLSRTNPNDDQQVGSLSNLSVWGAHPWSRADFANGNFRVRLTYVDGDNVNCSTNQAVQLDSLQVQVIFHTIISTTDNKEFPVPNPAGGPTPPKQKFWGAVFTSGGYRENGDRYSPSMIGNGTGAPAGNANPDYTGKGYDYLVEVGNGGGVQIFDPEFCATGDNGHGGSFGAGDHWTDPTAGGGTGFNGKPVAITYRLYDTKGTVANPNDDGLPVVPILRYDPAGKTYGDMSDDFGTPQNALATNRRDCAADAGHNKWVSMASGLAAGTYRLNVNTSITDAAGLIADSGNLATGAENMFSIYASGGSSARVYGAGRMAAYTNLDSGDQTFYFMQIPKLYAGKTIEISLFDPGECASGDAFVRFLNPDGNAYNNATFDWTADNGTGANGVTSIKTCSNGNALFNNRLITIEIDLKPTYGAVGLNPPGPPPGEPGWWRVQYQISAANDTTTWEVAVKGNPVHLILPN